MVGDGNEHRNSLKEDLREGRWGFVRIVLDEYHEQLHLVHESLDVVTSAKQLMFTHMFGADTKRGNLRSWWCFIALYLLIALVAIVVFFGCIFLCLLFHFRNVRCAAVWTSVMLLLMIAIAFVLVPRMDRGDVFSLSLDAATSDEWDHVQVALAAAEEHVQWLYNFTVAAQEINETLLSGLMRFSDRMTEITAASSNTPELAMDIIVGTVDNVHKQRMLLELLTLTHKDSSATLAAKHGEMHTLLDVMRAFEVYFASMESAIYTNLQSGLDINLFIVQNIDVLFDYARSGKLHLCFDILSDIHRHQALQLEKIRAANRFVADNNRRIAEMRRQTEAMQPVLESERLAAWLKKGVSTMTSLTAASSGGAMLLLPGISFGFPVATIGAIMGLAIAGIGYDWRNQYAVTESQCKDVALGLGGLEEVLRKTEASLSAHERTLVLLGETIEDVMRGLNNSRTRFEYVYGYHSFTEREVVWLHTSIRGIKDSVERLAGRYERAMQDMYGRILRAAAEARRPDMVPHVLTTPEPLLVDSGAEHSEL